MRSLRLPKSRVRSLSTYRILARFFRPENCNAVSDLGLRTARPGRYSTDRPACTVLVSTGRPVPGQWGRERGLQGGNGGSPRLLANGGCPHFRSAPDDTSYAR